MTFVIKSTYRFAALALLVLYSSLSFAQNDKGINVTAESMRSLTRNGQQIVRYLKNVNILHQGATMACDSAYLNRRLNVVEAFNRVVVTKEDTKLYGDFLYYDGNTSIGRVDGKEVKLVQKDATLVTNIIHFNTKNNSAYYNTYGVITNPENKLKSQKGYYYSDRKKYYFSGSVEMDGKDGRLYTDSLEYSAQDEIAYFYGPTRIYNKDNYSYCEKGWYNRKTDQSNLYKDAFIINKAQKIYGQDIFYDKLNGFARIVGKVAIVDTSQNVTIYGGKANYWEKSKEVDITENPLVLIADKGDTLFLRTNRLFVKSFTDYSLPDSTYRVIKALGQVRFFKKDIQGQCDSLLFNTKDSTISMFVTPVLWNENNQITANFIKAYTAKGNQLRRMDFEGGSFIASQEDKISYNQIRGKSMVASFSDGKLSKLDVNGNGEVVYFLRDEGTLAAVNKAESSDLTLSLRNNKISRISFKIKPVSTFYPIEKVNYEDITLKGFKWLDNLRPKSKMYIVPPGMDLVLTDAKKGFKKDI